MKRLFAKMEERHNAIIARKKACKNAKAARAAAKGTGAPEKQPFRPPQGR